MARNRNKIHDRTPTQHGAVVLYYLMKGRRWTTAQWSTWLGLSKQGVSRIFDNLSGEHDFAVAQNEFRQWAIFEDGEDVIKQHKKAFA